MRAAIVTGPGAVEIRQCPIPQPASGQVRLRLEGSGVCASNLVPWSGPDWMKFPTEPGALGHEGWGIVDAVGTDVTNVNVGDRVAALSYHCYATHDLAEAEAVVRLPDALSGKAFPAEPLACAVNIFERSDIKPGQTVAIVGIGFLGAMLTQMANRAGARVIAIGRRAWTLDIASQMGAAEAVLMDDHWRIIDGVKSLTSDVFCDRVIECTGKQWPLDLAAELTRERGRLVIAGYHQDGPRQVNMQLWNWRGLDVINAHEREQSRYIEGMKAAVDAVTVGALDPYPLITHTFGLEELGEALDMTRDRPKGFMKAIITYP
ncbi:MDR/zinc-dependent alcohol dehydrogenase-like family protein [Pelagibacterium luteolum]|uniref:Threonine dehydrogenase n=1 Tax=Pelagibacterium luteolum TaxID=440168 RepID=A0A1G8A5E2_9HYPH|nr:zinc-binding dehydrogenase [Pelagibacterium luteolum]SDH16067.1 Threonine dehydrogenase [Pelagibacterium luteolum]